MKSFLIKLPLIASLLLVAVVLAIWVRTYIIGDRYRWIGMYQDGNQFGLYNRSFTTGSGGLSILSEQSEPTNNPIAIARMKRYLATGRETRPGYAVFRTPKYPLPQSNPGEETALNSLGFHFSNTLFDDIRGVGSRIELSMPFWAIFALSATYPIACYAVGVVRRQREERGNKRICPRCGEPLTAASTRCSCCDLPILATTEV